MPSLSHLGLRDYDNVYEPSDDTYLLIDAIGLDVEIMEGKCNGEEEGNNTLKKHVGDWVWHGCPECVSCNAFEGYS